MASDSDSGMGHCCNLAWCCSEQGRLLRRKIYPRRDRKRSLPRGGVLSLDVVSKGRAAFPHFPFLQCRISGWGFWRCSRMGKSSSQLHSPWPEWSTETTWTHDNPTWERLPFQRFFPSSLSHSIVCCLKNGHHVFIIMYFFLTLGLSRASAGKHKC